MAYQIIEFDGIVLPYYNPEQQDSAAPVESSLLQSIGGVADYYGATTKRARMYGIELTGIYLGELTYMVDESGNRIVDEAGNYLIAGTGENMLRTQVQALRAKTGVRGQLVRIRQDDDAREWITARLLRVTHDKRREEMARLAKLSCTFESAMTAWRAETAAVATGMAASGAALVLLATNGGDTTVRDAVMSVACTSGTITAVTVTGSGISLAWAGSLATGQTLEIDAGDEQTVRVGTTDAYSGLTLGSGHTVAGWLPLGVGVTVLTVTVTGGDATVTVTHYDQFR